MKWLLQNPWVFVVLAGLVAQVLKGLRGAQGEAAETAPPKEFEFGDPELAERTRQIREEIRRKIEARRGQPQHAPPPAPEQPVLSRHDRSPEATPPPMVIELPRVVRDVFKPKPVPEPELTGSRESQLFAAEELERQRSIEKQMLGAAGLLQSAERREAFEETIADREPAAREQSRAALLVDLKDPTALRRAFVLREVLGPPLALR